jgi:hypothetical protein
MTYKIGTFKVHYGGFKEMGITLDSHNDPHSFPIAHTCFKTIEIPEY